MFHGLPKFRATWCKLSKSLSRLIHGIRCGKASFVGTITSFEAPASCLDVELHLANSIRRIVEAIRRAMLWFPIISTVEIPWLLCVNSVERLCMIACSRLAGPFEAWDVAWRRGRESILRARVTPLRLKRICLYWSLIVETRLEIRQWKI